MVILTEKVYFLYTFSKVIQFLLNDETITQGFKKKISNRLNNFPRFSPSFICHLVVGIMHFKRKKNMPVFRLDEIRRTDLNKGEEPRNPQLTIISTKLNQDIYRICDH